MEKVILEHKSEYPKMAQFITQAIMLDKWELDLIDVEEVEEMMRKMVQDEDFISIEFTSEMFENYDAPEIISNWRISFHKNYSEYTLYNSRWGYELDIPDEFQSKLDNILIGVHEYLIEEQKERIQGAKDIKETEDELNMWSR